MAVNKIPLVGEFIKLDHVIDVFKFPFYCSAPASIYMGTFMGRPIVMVVRHPRPYNPNDFRVWYYLRRNSSTGHLEMRTQSSRVWIRPDWGHNTSDAVLMTWCEKLVARHSQTEAAIGPNSSGRS